MFLTFSEWAVWKEGDRGSLVKNELKKKKSILKCIRKLNSWSLILILTSCLDRVKWINERNVQMKAAGLTMWGVALASSILREEGFIWIMMMIAQRRISALNSSTLYHHGYGHHEQCLGGNVTGHRAWAATCQVLQFGNMKIFRLRLFLCVKIKSATLLQKGRLAQSKETVLSNINLVPVKVMDKEWDKAWVGLKPIYNLECISNKPIYSSSYHTPSFPSSSVSVPFYSFE